MTTCSTSPPPPAPWTTWSIPIETLKVGAMGTHKALGLAKAKGARFLLASTSEVYGDPLVHPQPETYWGNVNPVGPRGVYDEAKRFAEAHDHGLSPRPPHGHPDRPHLQHLRPAHAARRRPRGAHLLRPGPQGEPLTVYGDGSQTRSFCYVRDLVDGIERLLESQGARPREPGQPGEFTLLEIAGT